jgi:hypothetical protein
MKGKYFGWVLWCKPVILATWEAEIGRIMVQDIMLFYLFFRDVKV